MPLLRCRSRKAGKIIDKTCPVWLKEQLCSFSEFEKKVTEPALTYSGQQSHSQYVKAVPSPESFVRSTDYFGWWTVFDPALLRK